MVTVCVLVVAMATIAQSSTKSNKYWGTKEGELTVLFLGETTKALFNDFVIAAHKVHSACLQNI